MSTELTSDSSRIRHTSPAIGARKQARNLAKCGKNKTATLIRIGSDVVLPGRSAVDAGEMFLGGPGQARLPIGFLGSEFRKRLLHDDPVTAPAARLRQFRMTATWTPVQAFAALQEKKLMPVSAPHLGAFLMEADRAFSYLAFSAGGLDTEQLAVHAVWNRYAGAWIIIAEPVGERACIADRRIIARIN